MRKRECTRCNVIKNDDDFSPQKTRPIFKYAWCDQCREEANNEKEVFIKPAYAKLIREDFDRMRAKAKELRKFNQEECKTIKARIDSGEKVTALAKELKTTTGTIRRASRGYN